jgi:hypothetical protein
MFFDKPDKRFSLGGEHVIENLRSQDSAMFEYDNFKEFIGVHLIDSYVHITKTTEYMVEDNPSKIEKTVRDNVSVDVHQIDTLIEMLNRIKTVTEILVRELNDAGDWTDFEKQLNLY